MTREDERGRSLAGLLVRRGFQSGDAALALLGSPALAAAADPEALADALGAAADPDEALTGLFVLADHLSPDERAELLGRLGSRYGADEAAGAVPLGGDGNQLCRRLVGVLGVSAALGDHLSRHPGDWRLLEASAPRFEPAAVGAAVAAAGAALPSDCPPAAAWSVRADALRVAYRRQLLVVAADDLTGVSDFAETSARLADLADAALQAALDAASADLPPDAEPCRLAVIAMGKTGGRELNYISDVDVVFVAEALPGREDAEPAALRTATKLATALVRYCGSATAEGSLWEVDAGLRPEGKNGPLVRTLRSHLAYYARWAKTWEFQALLKARPAAGDAELGRAYAHAVAPLVWSAATRDAFVEDVQAMRRRVEASVPRQQAGRALKLGPGGLRDVEFSVQLLQLVHGRDDPALRSSTTLVALEALRRGGYVGRDDGRELADAYRFLRTLEHRIQLHRLRRSHVVPDDEQDLRRLGRSMGFRTAPVEELTRAWRAHATEVRRLHEKLFYRPLLNAVARLAPGEARLSSAAARRRLEALGYADPAGALRHLEALTTGVSRRAVVQRTLLPVMLGWFADAPDPDAGLLAFRRVSEELGSTPWYLRLLRDGAAAERLATLVATSRYATDLLLRAPEAVVLLGDDVLRLPGREALTAEVAAAVRRHDDPESAAAAARAVRRRELFRIASADVLGLIDLAGVGSALADVMAATLGGLLDAAVLGVERQLGGPLPVQFAVIGMGRFGGRELNYGSDADVLFVHNPHPGVDPDRAQRIAVQLVHELRRLAALPGGDPPVLLDADLRPEGRSGPLARSFRAYEAYYARWSRVWESQALLRAEPVAGDADLGRRFCWLVEPMRWPDGGVDDAAVREIRRIKARVEAERLPRGADPSTHTKLGRGGLADVEWTVQLLQLRHAGRVAALRTTSTLPALRAAADAGLLDRGDAEALERSWSLASRVRNAALLVRGRPADSLPTGVRDLAGVAQLVGQGPGGAAALLEEYRRVTRRARSVVERVFYA